MDKIYDLRDMLCKELEAYGARDDLNAGTLDIVDKLAHAIKNIDKIIASDEGMMDGYSSRSPYDSINDWAYADGRSYNGRGSSYRGRSSRYSGRSSYARTRDRMGRYSGRYSRAEGTEDMVMELRGLMNDAQDPQIRDRISDLIGELERA